MSFVEDVQNFVSFGYMEVRPEYRGTILVSLVSSAAVLLSSRQFLQKAPFGPAGVTIDAWEDPDEMGYLWVRVNHPDITEITDPEVSSWFD